MNIRNLAKVQQMLVRYLPLSYDSQNIKCIKDTCQRFQKLSRIYFVVFCKEKAKEKRTFETMSAAYNCISLCV